jgi:hypothetical protein
MCLQGKKEGWIIDEESNFKLVWDTLVFVAVIYIAFVTPYRLAFDFDDTKHDAWFVIDALITALFVMDMLLMFFTAQFDENSLLVIENHREIALRYLKGMFVFDLLSVFPFSLIFSTHKINAHKSIKLVRLFRIYRLLKLLRLSRLTKTYARYDK